MSPVVAGLFFIAFTALGFAMCYIILSAKFDYVLARYDSFRLMTTSRTIAEMSFDFLENESVNKGEVLAHFTKLSIDLCDLKTGEFLFSKTSHTKNPISAKDLKDLGVLIGRDLKMPDGL